MASGLGLALLLGGCGGQVQKGQDQNSGSTPAGADKPLLLVSYAVTKSAYDRILPRFQAAWKAKTGKDLAIRTS
ncbi:MAG: sulfate ABC transporter substrate-binding protein, partial [Cyanobacteriota bacterium]